MKLSFSATVFLFLFFFKSVGCKSRKYRSERMVFSKSDWGGRSGIFRQAASLFFFFCRNKTRILNLGWNRTLKSVTKPLSKANFFPSYKRRVVETKQTRFRVLKIKFINSKLITVFCFAFLCFFVFFVFSFNFKFHSI